MPWDYITSEKPLSANSMLLIYIKLQCFIEKDDKPLAKPAQEHFEMATIALRKTQCVVNITLTALLCTIDEGL
jgi:hypothetical protein